MITTTYELRCDDCGKVEAYIDSNTPHNKPQEWYILRPNHEHSSWWFNDSPVGGDFCSLECIVNYAGKAIEERGKVKVEKIASFVPPGSPPPLYIKGSIHE